MRDKIPVGFSNNDFFYKNVRDVNIDGNSWGIGKTNDLCSKDDNQLRILIESYLKDFSYNIPSQPISSGKQGQCTLTPSSSGEPGSSTNWQLVYGKDANGNQTCTCTSASSISNSSFAGYQPYISSDSKKFELGTGATATNYYKCAKSTPLQFTDNGINTEINTNNIRKTELIDKLVIYYKSLCRNELLAKKIMQTNSQNSNGELQYQDAIDKYNREYLNRINLGIGIIFTSGIISYFLMTKSLPKISPTVPTIPLPK